MEPSIAGVIGGCARSLDESSCASAPLDGRTDVSLDLSHPSLDLHSIHAYTTAPLTGSMSFNILGGATATLDPGTLMEYAGPSLEATLVPNGECALGTLCSASFSLPLTLDVSAHGSHSARTRHCISALFSLSCVHCVWCR